MGTDFGKHTYMFAKFRPLGGLFLARGLILTAKLVWGTSFGNFFAKIGPGNQFSVTGQEEADHMRRMSELFTRSTALKFANTLNQ